ncbi:hypothetical protein [Duganella sp. Root1480D1]|uniref:hypothetical protein n=1 Tax=Duganella sp. Root1480D1 TaxID=1736471 RepID=UPI000708AD84|nr:hypothetical protein [Duganella sp. Root1480D1]KQZ27060.1 hypothetical protein ASD58_15940 [Duganella sp. Root1480D1]
MCESTKVARHLTRPSMPANSYGEHDSERRQLLVLDDISANELAQRAAVRLDVAAQAMEADGNRRLHDACSQAEQERLLMDLRKVYAQASRIEEEALHITDVCVEKAVLSNRPFELRIRFQNFGRAPVALAAVRTNWSGESFVIEQLVDCAGRDGEVLLTFDQDHTLPIGQAEFEVCLFREDGAMSGFTRNVYVLPSNPLSLGLSPAGARVTGTWSARGDYHPESDTFLTECMITLANGDAWPVSMGRNVAWEFWDGPVGNGTRIEVGGFDWFEAITVPAYGVWNGSVWFSSPRGSGIFNVLDRKEDMALSITMRANDGRVVRGEITVRTMLSFGVNIIKVGNFGWQEHVDLYAAVDRMRQIYERRDITLRQVNRFIIPPDLAGGYQTLDSEDEIRDMWEDWSCANDSIDVFVAQDFNWASYNGLAGGIPGPASKGGRRDGVAVEKTGYTDGSGTQRLDVATLAQLIGHEVGHYLGLEHLEDANNIMRSNTGVRGPDINYDQYRRMFPHGFMHYE